jgi:hypothetical protein
MSKIIELIIGIFKALFSVSMENPIERKEKMTDVGNTQFENPDDYFLPSDW